MSAPVRNSSCAYALTIVTGVFELVSGDADELVLHRLELEELRHVARDLDGRDDLPVGTMHRRGVDAEPHVTSGLRVEDDLEQVGDGLARQRALERVLAELHRPSVRVTHLERLREIGDASIEYVLRTEAVEHRAVRVRDGEAVIGVDDEHTVGHALEDRLELAHALLRLLLAPRARLGRNRRFGLGQREEEHPVVGAVAMQRHARDRREAAGLERDVKSLLAFVGSNGAVREARDVRHPLHDLGERTAFDGGARRERPERGVHEIDDERRSARDEDPSGRQEKRLSPFGDALLVALVWSAVPDGCHRRPFVPSRGFSIPTPGARRVPPHACRAVGALLGGSAAAS